jgi:hypothetical protein
MLRSAGQAAEPEDATDVVILHRGIDTEATATHQWDAVKQVKGAFKGSRLLVLQRHDLLLDFLRGLALPSNSDVSFLQGETARQSFSPLLRLSCKEPPVSLRSRRSGNLTPSKKNEANDDENIAFFVDKNGFYVAHSDKTRVNTSMHSDFSDKTVTLLRLRFGYKGRQIPLLWWLSALVV